LTATVLILNNLIQKQERQSRYWCDVINNEIPVADNTYDYVYTSHLIEDFVDTKDALRKFIRILKMAATWSLFSPISRNMKCIAMQMNIPMNPYHIHADMGYDYMMKKLNELEGISYDILFTVIARLIIMW
jgi:ubiquinone/menaquinone biosynthesis C-methylase UbiE